MHHILHIQTVVVYLCQYQTEIQTKPKGKRLLGIPYQQPPYTKKIVDFVQRMDPIICNFQAGFIRGD